MNKIISPLVLLITLLVGCDSKRPQKSISVTDLSYEELSEAAKLHLEKGELKEALAFYHDMIIIDSTRIEGYYGSGVCLSIMCNNNLEYCSESNRLFDKAIQIDSTYRKIFYNRGSNYFKLNEFPKALENFDIYIIQNPMQFKAFYNRALTYLQIKDSSRACQDLQKAIELGFNQPAPEFEKLCISFSEEGLSIQE